MHGGKRRVGVGAAALLTAGVLFALTAVPVAAAGSQNLFTPSAGGSRADTEWRTSTYGGGAVYRRTLLHVYVTTGEYLLMGSSGVGVGAADILVWNPGLVGGTTGLETLQAASYSCAAQRAASAIVAQGRIQSRAAELAGPETVPGGGVVGGYTPCWYRATATGVYSVVMVGPAGFSSNVEPQPAADLSLTSPRDFDATQGTAVAAWDITVRDALTSPVSRTGRVFTYLLSLFAGGNGQPINMSTYPVTPDGYRYRVDNRGMDPAGWVQYGTQLGFLDPDGHTPLYHDALAAATGAPQQLTTIQAGVQFAKPDYPIFFEPPDSAALTALGIPLAAVPPGVSGATFTGARASTAVYGSGGTFTYAGTTAGVFQIVISRDGVNFDPTLPANRVLRGLRPAGLQTVTWDGRDNSGTKFPVGTGYAFTVDVHGGEYHLPFVDVENDVNGGPTITLLDPPGGLCPPLTGGCSSGFYDDRGYTTTTGQTVGTPGAVLCGNAPPALAHSDPVLGFDTRTTQRAFGTPTGGNTNVPCTGSFGDTKGLDIWTYYPSVAGGGQLAVVDTATVTLPTPLPVPPTPSVGAPLAPMRASAGTALTAFGAALVLAARSPRRRLVSDGEAPRSPVRGSPRV